MNEKWRLATIPGARNNYEVSNQGNVRNAHTHQILKPQIIKGRRCISFRFNGVKHRRQVLISGLVAKAFLPPRPPGKQIEHKNQNKLDDRADNLTWMTQSQNIKRSFQLSDRLQRPAHRDRFCNRFLSEAAHELVKELWATGRYSQVRIGRAVGLHNSTVSLIVRGFIKAREDGHLDLVVDWEVLTGSK